MTFDLEKLHLHMFMGHPDIELSFDEITELYGRNSSGKSSIANAFAFAMTGMNFWGNKLTKPINSGHLMWVEVTGSINGKQITFKRMLEEVGGKNKNTLTEDINVDDKDVLLSIVNPRYFSGVSAVAAKNILLKIANLDTDCIPICFPERHDFAEAMEEELNGGKASSLGLRWDAVEKTKKDLSDQLKELECLSDRNGGEIDGYNKIVDFIKSAGLSQADLVNQLDNKILQCQQKVIDIENEKDIVKKKINTLDSYRRLLVSMAVKCIEDKLDDVKIQLDDNGKDVFNVTFKDKDYKALSNSEQLRAGLEISNAIAELSGSAYPCFVDNAEALQVTELDLYPSIIQFVFLSVADVDLSIYREGMLTNPITKETMIRTKASMTPKVLIVGGWER